MPTWKETIGKATGLTSTVLTAILAAGYGNTPGITGPVMTVLSGILTNIGSEFVFPVGQQVLQQFVRKNPDELNHDIQRVLIESMRQAVEGIEALYREKHPDKPFSRQNRRSLRRFKKEFFAAWLPESGRVFEKKDLKTIIYENADPKENRLLYDADEENKISRILSERIENILAGQGFDEAFRNFLKEKFLPLTQFYFSEKLKSNENAAARRAMERMLSEETLSGINRLIEVQEKTREDHIAQTWLTRAAKLPKKKIEELKSLLSSLKSSNELEVRFSEAFDKKFEELLLQYRSLHDEVAGIRTHVKGIRRTLSVDRRVGAAIIIVCVIVTTAIIVSSRNRPFHASLMLVNDPAIALHPDYPPRKSPATLHLLLPDRSEEIIINSASVGTSQPLPGKWINQKVAVRLEDEFWKTSADSILLSEERVNIPVCPNGKLAYIEGSVRIAGSSGGVKGAEIQIGKDTSLYTNADGSFRITLPVGMQKKRYEVTVVMAGYGKQTEYYYPGSTPLQFILTSEK